MEHLSRESDGRVILSLSGEIDINCARELRDLLLDPISAGRDVAVDLSGVSYLDSSGIASLVEAFQRARAEQTGFALIRLSEAARKVIELARLDQVFLIADDLGALS